MADAAISVRISRTDRDDLRDNAEDASTLPDLIRSARKQ
jgi:hypothetical protein